LIRFQSRSSSGSTRGSMAMYSPQVEAARQGLKSELAQTTMRARRALFKDADLPTSE